MTKQDVETAVDLDKHVAKIAEAKGIAKEDVVARLSKVACEAFIKDQSVAVAESLLVILAKYVSMVDKEFFYD